MLMLFSCSFISFARPETTDSTVAHSLIALWRYKCKTTLMVPTQVK